MDSQYLDSYGLPGTRQQDGSLDMGDSAAIYFNVLALDTKSIQFCNYLDQDGKAPVRHPDVTQWWGQSDRFSRDQLIPVLCASILRSNRPSALFNSHAKRLLLLAWNTKGNGQMDMPSKFPDVTGPEIWGLWLRIYKPFGYKALLPLCDLETLIGALNWKYVQPASNRVTRNHMLVSIAQAADPSFISKLAYKLNNWDDLIARWEAHTQAVGEYPTADLFKRKIYASK